MARNILDILKGDLLGTAAVPSPSGTGTTPLESSQEERAAVQELESSQQLSRQDLAAELSRETEKRAGIQAVASQQQKELEIERRFSFSKWNSLLEQTLQEYAAEKRRISTMGDVGNMELSGQLIRLQSEDYTARLQRAGEAARLQDDTAFKEAVARDVFSSDTALLQNDLLFKEFLNMSENELLLKIENMDVGFAIDLARREAQTTNIRAIGEGVGKSISAVSEWVSRQPSPPLPKPNGP